MTAPKTKKIHIITRALLSATLLASVALAASAQDAEPEPFNPPAFVRKCVTPDPFRFTCSRMSLRELMVDAPPPLAPGGFTWGTINGVSRADNALPFMMPGLGPMPVTPARTSRRRRRSSGGAEPVGAETGTEEASDGDICGGPGGEDAHGELAELDRVEPIGEN